VRARFGPFTIDSETRQLLSQGRDIHLSPKAFDLLCTLIETRPKVVDKADLRARIWPNTYVVDANLNILIGEIRRALGDDVQDSRFIRTVHGVGYAFCGTAADDPRPRTEGQARFCWVVWNGRAYPLAEGDNIVGVRLEDLRSTNGTFVGRSAVETEVSLNDGDLIQVGTVDLTVRLWATDKLPETKKMGRGIT